MMPNKEITGADAGGPRRLAIRSHGPPTPLSFVVRLGPCIFHE